MDIFKLFRRVNINQEIEIYKTTPGAVLLDVRSDEEFSAGHIPGSINIPVERISGVEKIIMDHNVPVFIYCLRGTRSLRAAEMMRKSGYKNVKSIGGIVSYKGMLEK